MYARSVTIGPEFFAKSFNDYRDRFWAFAREILQNSLDCGSTRIDITIVETPDDDRTVVVVGNDGEPMTREVLVDKLLSLGSSGKDFQGAVGGFGKAKEILYFAHVSYTIDSGPWRVSGSGAGYDLEEGDTPFPGTRSAVTWAGLVGDKLRGQFRRFIALCDRRGCAFTLNGEPLRPEIPRFRALRPLGEPGSEWAHLGVHHFEEHLLVVRIGGLPMFVERSDCRRTIVLELQGPSGQRLTANRDGLRYPYSTRLRDLITQMAVDRRSALKKEEPVYTRFAGAKLRCPRDRAEDIEDRVVARVSSPPARDAGGGIVVAARGRTEAPEILGHQFVVKDCLRRRLPREFDPESLTFSDHAHWLVRAWAGCLLELYAIHGSDHEFSTGFVFGAEAEAEFEESSGYGRVYYLNPCITGKRSMRRRWKKADRGEIAAVAAHEFVHGGMGLSYHGEDFANALTDVTGRMIKGWRRFARHFK